MPTENKAVPFEREERYIVLKLKRLPKDEAEYLRDCHPKAMVECVVVERDWPEYHMVWAMLEHRMAGKPVPNFNDWRRADELQQRLTAADERMDVLEGLIGEVLDAVGREPLDLDAVLRLRARMRAALKPAEAPRNQCDGCQACIPLINGTHRMGREGGYPDFMVCSAKLYKPAEGVGDDTTLEEDREDFKKVFVRINTKQGQSISLADMIARYEKKP